MSEMQDDVRSAFDKVEQTETKPAETTSVEPAPSTTDGTEANTSVKADVPAKPEGDAGTPAATPTGTEDDDRDYPLSWKKDYRPHWKSVPADVRKEIARRESDIARAMKLHEDARKHREEFERIASPYMADIQAENSTPLQAFANMMQTARMLRTSSAPDRAKLIAGLVQRFGVDVEILDKELAGKLSPAGRTQQEVSETVARELQPVRQFMSAIKERERMAQDRAMQDTYGEIGKFQQDHQHFDQVRLAMADLIELADRNGEKMSMDDAYNRAVWMNPETRDAMMRSEERKRAEEQNQKAMEAKRKAASVAGSPASSTSVPSGENMRDAISSAWDRHAG